MVVRRLRFLVSFDVAVILDDYANSQGDRTRISREAEDIGQGGQ